MSNSSLAPGAKAARALWHQGDLAGAQRAVARLLESGDSGVEVWALASDIALRQGRFRDASTAAEQAVRLDPGNSERYVQSAHCHFLTGDCVAALSAVDAALSTGARSADHLASLAAVLFHCNEHERARELYIRASAIAPWHVETARGLALTCRALGRIAEAEAAANSALALDPDDHEVLHLRSSLRRQTAASNHVDQLKQVISRGAPQWRGAVQVGYALAKELEDLGRYEESFSYLSQAASLKRKHTVYDIRDDEATLQRIRTAFSGGTLASLAGRGYSSSEPIFVLGLPRTGSTLVERIIASHPEVQSAGELSTFALELVRLTTAENGNRPVQKALLPQASTRVNMRELGRNYVDAARPATFRARRFIDKMPINALYVGLIHLALPDARIVLVERSAVDACYAMYKFLFKNAYPFSYDLEEAARYYLAHEQLMRHWEAVLPRETLCRVQYEALVTDQEAVSRRLVRALGLDWSDACLGFERHAGATTTGSATQVREPIYRSSVGLWRHYRRQLAPLLRVLDAGGVDVSCDDR